MAYKFQLGKAKLSGSIETAQAITSQGGLTVNGDVDLDNGVINNAELANSSVMFNGVTVALGATGSFGTDAVTEGESNKYYTDARARAAVSVSDVSGDGSLSYDSATGVISYTGPSASEVRAHLSAGDGLAFAGGQFAVSSSIAGAGLAWSSGVLSVDTAEIAAGLSGSVEAMIGAFVEGSDFVTFDDGTGTIGVSAAAFTGSARSVVSVTDAGGDGSLSYNSSTGVITYTGPSAAEARAHFSAVDAGGDGSFSYADGVFTYTGPSAAEARAHFSADGEGIEYNSTSGQFSLELTGTSLAKSASGLRTNITVNKQPAFSNGDVLFNNANGELTFKPVEEAWVRQRLSAVNAIKYNSASGSISLQLSGTSLSQSADGLRADLKTKVGAYDNSGSLSYNSADGQFTFRPVDPAWVKGHFSAGAGLDYADGVFSVGTAEVTNAMLSGAIENAKLVNSSVSVVAGGALSGGGTVALGSSITLDVEVNGDALEIDGDQIKLKSTIAGERTFSGNVIMSGDLTVNGTTTYVNTTNLVVEDALITIASGSAFAAGIGIELGANHSLQTISGDAVVGNALSSSLPLVAPSVKASTFYGNLEGAMLLGIETKSANATISKNVTKATANITLTLPSLPVTGQEHRVKCFVADESSPAVVVEAQTGGTIEGLSSIVLESYGAAVSLVWDGSMWMVF